MTCYSLFCFHLLHGSHLYSQSKIISQSKIKTLESKALKNFFKKQQDSVSHKYKELKILKFLDLLLLQNCLFISQIEPKQRLANHFGLIDVPFVNTQIYNNQSVKSNYIILETIFRIYLCTNVRMH